MAAFSQNCFLVRVAAKTKFYFNILKNIFKTVSCSVFCTDLHHNIIIISRYTGIVFFVYLSNNNNNYTSVHVTIIPNVNC